MSKKLLVIGNGFDLAHGLPTRYADFLEFAFLFQNVYTYGCQPLDQSGFNEKVSSWGGITFFKTLLSDFYSIDRTMLSQKQSEGKPYSVTLNDPILDRMAEDLYCNTWFSYFYHIHTNGMFKGGNWIDFESEISDVIQFIDNNTADMDELFEKANNRISFGSGTPEKIKIFFQFCDSATITKDYGGKVEGFINKLYDDLEKITDALNVYLSRFVEKLSVSPIKAIEEIDPDFVISFNYTHTYLNKYKKDIPVCYIHGECKDSEDNSCNMVIGIDEYLDEKERNTNTKMAIFKKFVQRIRKKNDTQYRQWLDEMREIYSYIESNSGKAKQLDSYRRGFSDVYVYGHSLDETDIDVLKLFLKPDYTSIHIYAKDKVNEGKIISNLIKIIEEETLIEKSYGNPPRLEIRGV